MNMDELRGVFPHWEKTKDIIDQLIDIILNYRQSDILAVPVRKSTPL